MVMEARRRMDVIRPNHVGARGEVRFRPDDRRGEGRTIANRKARARRRYGHFRGEYEQLTIWRNFSEEPEEMIAEEAAGREDRKGTAGAQSGAFVESPGVNAGDKFPPRH